ncbi:Rpn family recombination-promoting nuclease/putative transposase [Cohnella sp. 56]|uniref:Rpn family recombination-promoting nuclease/putative transposase n=1 Tax=Cohnella sp. 56 TaxID=3113722 RepID=UPI0030E76D46
MGNRRQAQPTRHDEAFKKLLQTFFAEFMALFFPEVHRRLDYSKAKLLMQEQLVDIVGRESRTLDLLIEAQLLEAREVFVLLHYEPQFYRDNLFKERMFIYFSRLFEKYRVTHKQIIPVAIFAGDSPVAEPDGIDMGLPGSEEEILRFRYLKVELKKRNWREFAQSDNPVAAALLARMGYNRRERRELRFAYLRMLLRIKDKLDPARMSLVMAIADLYFDPKPDEDYDILQEMRETIPEEEALIMELMPAWKRWGYEEGMEKGIEQGIEQGIEKGIVQGMEKGMERGAEAERRAVVRKLASKGLEAEAIAEILDLPLAEVKRLYATS